MIFRQTGEGGEVGMDIEVDKVNEEELSTADQIVVENPEQRVVSSNRTGLSEELKEDPNEVEEASEPES